MDSKPLMLAPLLRLTIAIAAALNLLIGLAFLLGPELGITLWPSPIPREMMRFIGSIVFANGIGAAMIVRKPTWENSRVLVAVALVYALVSPARFATLRRYDLLSNRVQVRKSNCGRTKRANHRKGSLK